MLTEDEIGRMSLHKAVLYRRETAVRIIIKTAREAATLLERVDANVQSVLHLAALLSKDAMCAILLGLGASVTSTDK